MAYVMTARGATVDADMVRKHLEASGFARWQLPDQVVVIDEIPKTVTGSLRRGVPAKLGP